MPGRRVQRLNEQFRRELTEILMGEARDPRVAGVTLTAVRVAPDLSFARVFVAPQADPEANREALAGLAAAMPFLRKELGARLHVRRVPEMRFELDNTLAQATRIEQLLREVAGSTAEHEEEDEIEDEQEDEDENEDENEDEDEDQHEQEQEQQQEQQNGEAGGERA